MSELLNQQQLCKALGISDFTVRAWLRDGVIPAEINEGKTLRFDIEDVRAALKKRAAKKAKAVKA